MTLSEFFSMNSYGFYIWSSFGMTAMLMLGELIMVKKQNRTILQRLRRIIRLKTAGDTHT